ncbi:MAG: hypothetical protein LBB56_07235 [Chitinispirillales bacterium]|jgi:hypothetical protein|nr:hypothetical protein [Chitinispirillales bacterium]
MTNKKFWLGMLVLALVICGSLTSCWSSGTARETLPQTAVTIQRVRATDTLLGEVLGATDTSLDTPMQIFIDNNKEPLELANGATTTILVNNGELIVYAVLGSIESKSVRFTAKSQTISVNVSTKKPLVGRITLEIEVK